VIEQEVELRTKDGVMPTFVTHPEEGGTFPAILFYMDAPGMREELRDMARRIGTAGYCVLLPNLYYRDGAPVDLDYATEDGRKNMFKLMENLSNELLAADTAPMLDYVDLTPAARDGAVGIVGYCMSGPFVTYVAAAYPDRVAAAASMYGVRLVTDKEDSPHRHLPKVKGELYFGCAETDSWAPPEMIEQLEVALRDAGTRHRVEWYAGTEHGFGFPQRPAYDKAAAERHWERLFSLFGRNLSPQDSWGGGPS